MESEPQPSTSSEPSTSKEQPTANEPYDFERKTAHVFGGAGGIGMAICEALLKKGISHLAILDIVKISSHVRAQLQEIKPNAIILSEICDITDKAAIEYTYRRLGPADLLVHSAGIVDERDPARLIDINLVGPISSSILALAKMSKEAPRGQGGIIVNIASIAGLDPTPFMSVYSASKFGLVGFTRSMGHDLTYEHTGVKFIVLCPGMTETPLLSRFFAGEDLLFPAMKDITLQARALYPAQSPSVVGECLIKALEDGAENGSVWVSMEGNNRKLEMPASLLVNRT